MTLSAMWLGADGYQTTVEDHRQLAAATFGYHSSGILHKDQINVTPTNPANGLGVDVAPFRYVFDSPGSVDNGSYLIWNSEAETLLSPAPSVLPRIDTLILVIADAQFGAVTGDQGPQFVWATGTPASSPVALSTEEIELNWAQPGGWQRLANITVNPGDTAFVSGDIDISMQKRLWQTGEMITLRQESGTWPTNATYVDSNAQRIGLGVAPSSVDFVRTFKPHPKRCYEITFHSDIVDGNGVATGIIDIRYASGTSVTTSSTALCSRQVRCDADASTTASGANLTVHLENWGDGETNWTMGAYLRSAEGAVRLMGFREFTIKDVGPARAVSAGSDF